MAKKQKLPTTFQYIVIAFYGALVFLELITIYAGLFRGFSGGRILQLNYLRLLVPAFTTPMGLFGLYKITRKKRRGFFLFYLAFLVSTVLDITRGTTLFHSLVTIPVGNLVLFLVFHYATSSLRKNSS